MAMAIDFASMVDNVVIIQVSGKSEKIFEWLLISDKWFKNSVTIKHFKWMSPPHACDTLSPGIT